MFTSLLQMLDHPKIDFYIHMDAKNKSYNPAETLKLVKFSRVVHTPRIKVSWGSYSQIEAEMILLEATTSQEHYGHYHLLSGSDLPIKRTEDIIAFFEEHEGVEFVDCGKTFQHEHWVRYYYPFQELKGRKGSLFVQAVAKVCLLVQKALHVHRNKGINFKKGGQWFSITDKFARYVLSKKDWIYRVFSNTLHGEEICMQTLLCSSEFWESRQSCQRLIDWTRSVNGGPHTFTIADIEQITSSPAMFARKFHPSVDAQTIDKIRELYS